MIGERFYLPFLSNGFPICPQELSLFVSSTRGWWLSFLAVDGRETVASMVSQLGETVCVWVLDTDLSYSQVLSLSQGWINKVKRSNAGETPLL